MTVRILPNDKGQPAGKLADAELHFTSGPLAGLRLLGFAVWERRSGPARNVTFPARTYAVNGERRSFSLLRPGDASHDASNRVRDLILQAYSEYERSTGEAAYQAATVPNVPTMAEIRRDVDAGKAVSISAIIDAQRADRTQTDTRKFAPPPSRPHALDLF